MLDVRRKHFWMLCCYIDIEPFQLQWLTMFQTSLRKPSLRKYPRSFSASLLDSNQIMTGSGVAPWFGSLTWCCQGIVEPDGRNDRSVDQDYQPTKMYVACLHSDLNMIDVITICCRRNARSHAWHVSTQEFQGPL